MKKIVSLLLVLALVLGTMTVALAVPADVIGTEYEEVATKLGALGLMIGDDRGFRPNDSITRAEFATIVVRALGLESAAKFSTSATKFTDVTEAHQWAWGYINVATEQGVIIGYGDNKFGPADPVTYEQAITMLVRALGYEPAVVGGYPAGYLAKAAELDITEDVTVTAGAGAPRGAVAQMLDNSLEVKLMERTSFGDEKKYEAVDKTIIEDKLGVEIVNGIVDSVDDDEITIENKDYELAEGVEAKALVGVKVKAWEKGDKVIFVEEDADLLYDVIAELNDDTDDVAYDAVTEVKLAVSGKTYNVEDDPAAEIYIDNDAAAAGDELSVGMFVKIVLDGNKIVRIEAYDMNKVDNGIITAVEEDYIEYNVGTTEGRKLRVEDAEELLVVVDGKVAKYDDLKEDMVFSAWEEDDEFVIAATTGKVEGALSRVKSDEIRIDDTYYDLASSSYYSTDDGEDYSAVTGTSSFDDLLAEDVAAYLDIAGNVVYVKGNVEEDTSEFVGYVLNKWQTEYDYVKVYTDKGETVTYKLDDDISYGDVAEGSFYNFEIDEDGFVVAADVINHASAIAAGDVTEFDADDDFMKIDGDVYFVTDDTVIVDLSDTDEPEIAAWDDIKGNDKLDDLAGSFEANAKGQLELVVFTAGIEDLGDDDSYVAFVLDSAKVSKDDFDLEVDKGDEIVNITVKDTDLNSAAADMMVIYNLKADGKAEIAYATAVEDLDILDTPDIDDDAAGYVAALEDIDGEFIKFAAAGSWYKVDEDAIIYELNSDGEYEQADLSDIDAGDEVWYYMVDDVVQALFFTR